MSKDEPRVSVTSENEKPVRTSKQRQSLPIGQSKINPSLRQTQSFNNRKPKISIVTVETIPENEDTNTEVNENEDNIENQIKINGTNRLSHISSTRGIRKSSSYDNGAFESDHGTNLKRATSKTSLSPSVLERGSISARSSTRTSTTSLQIQREQYCCCSKWSPCEKRLASCVAILGTIIIILVIVVGILAGDNGGIDELRMIHPLPL